MRNSHRILNKLIKRTFRLWYDLILNNYVFLIFLLTVDNKIEVFD